MPINTMAMQAPYTDYGQELEELQRRQRYAEMLREQSMQAPQAPEAKGRLSAPTHWTQLAAGLLKNSSALSQLQEGHKERKALSQRYQDESHKNLAAALMKARGTPMQATEDAAGNVDVQQQAVKPDIPGAGMDLMRNPNPMMQQMGAGALGQVFNPKTVSPDALLRAQIEMQKHGTPSASATLQEGGRNTRHAVPSGGDVLREQGATGRHQTPSGSAILGERGAMARHGSPSGSALVAAETARRGQDMTNARALQANALAAQTVRLKQEELTNKLQQQGVANAGVVASYQIATETLDRLKTHPGLSEAVGVGWEKTALPFVGPIIPGTDRADFVAELEAFKSQVFLPMVQNLRGMGALSDAEGKKLTAAVGALETNMSEAAFNSSIEKIKKDLAAAQQRLQTPQRRATDKPGAGLPSPAEIDAELRRRQGG